MPEQLQVWIDTPKRGNVDDRDLSIVGWCFNKKCEPADPIVALDVVAGAATAQAQLVPRPDVVRHFSGHPPLHCGFTAVLSPPQGNHAIELHAATQNGYRYIAKLNGWTFTRNPELIEFSCKVRTGILNRLLAKYRYQTYLEIGVERGVNFRKICLPAAQKVGVDPAGGPGVLPMTSDQFFASNRQRFDLIFIDGLHHELQVHRDILNSLACLSPGGTIVCHDMNPPTYEAQVVPQTQSEWTGDCWKAWVRLRRERSDLEMKVIDADYGCGIIRRGQQALLKADSRSDWNGFVVNRAHWLNLNDVESFQRELETD